MVNELDLTDQDITTIADMIDSEVRALVPDWSPKESSGGDSAFDTHTTDSKEDSSPHHSLENKDDMSPLANASSFFTSSIFPDQLPSGRVFWSDSPKTGGGLSPAESSPKCPSETIEDNESSPQKNNLPELETDKEILTEGIDKTYAGPVSHKRDCGGLPPKIPSIFHLGNDNDFVFLEKKSLENQRNIEVGHEQARTEELKCGEEVCYSKKDGIITFPVTQNGEGDNSESELRIIADKLDQLFAQQQKQLEELKWKHKLEISHVLKDVPPQMHLKVLKMCSRKMASDDMPNVVGYNAVGDSSKASAKRIFTRSLSTLDISSSRTSNFKQESMSEMGIAVILKHDSAEV